MGFDATDPVGVTDHVSHDGTGHLHPFALVPVADPPSPEFPEGTDAQDDEFPDFLWLFTKQSSSSNEDDDRAVAVFELVKVEKLEGVTVEIDAEAVQKVKLTYQLIFGGEPGDTFGYGFSF